MILRKLSITSYKNIRQASLVLSPKINCFVGHNGAGKTNILDAVYYMSFCHSASTTIDAQLICHGDDFFILDGDYESDDGDRQRIYSAFKKGTKKVFKHDDKSYKRLSQHIGTIPLVAVGPSDIMLIEDGSEQRRRLMDIAISQYDHAYLDILNAYNKVLQQRNALLKQENEPDATLMDIVEQQMATNGEVIYAKRNDFISGLTPVFQDIYNIISGKTETVGLAYKSHCQRGPLLEVIRSGRAKDRILGYSTHGVHRDDIEMTLGGYPMKIEGSQGQNKTFVVSLKLAQFDYLRHKASQTMPLLLLDDIFDKLDALRVERIVRLVASERYGQIFITDTNREHIDNILHTSTFDYKLFNVDNGVISEVNNE